MIKFTFDIEQVINTSKIENYSSVHGKFGEYSNTTTQKELIKLLPKKYKTKLGFCAIMSIYNAFPIFKTINELSKFVINLLDNGVNFASLRKLTKEINNYLNSNDLQFDIQNLKKSYEIFTKNIDNKKSIVITYKCLNELPINHINTHAITLVGYNKNYIFYIENSDDNYLYKSLGYYLYFYYKIGNKQSKNKLIKKMLKAKEEENIWKIIKEILGYKKFTSNICAIKKEFLTNGKFFYDVNQLVTYNKDLQYNFDCNSPNMFNIKLSDNIYKE